MSSHTARPVFDRIGIALSGLCLIHCLALPVLVALLPVLASSAMGDFAEAEWFHAAMLVPVVLVSGSVLGRRVTRVRWLAPLMVAAFGTMVGALFVGEDWQEQALTVVGASLLILAHWLNLREHRPA